jgi:hypothetical protein
MTSIISTPGKYRSRKEDWGGNRIENGDSSIEEEQSNLEMSTELMDHTKPPRRISLAMGFLVGSDKHNKRRSSIAVPFIRRKYSSSQKVSLHHCVHPDLHSFLYFINLLLFRIKMVQRGILLKTE